MCEYGNFFVVERCYGLFSLEVCVSRVFWVVDDCAAAADEFWSCCSNSEFLLCFLDGEVDVAENALDVFVFDF